MDLDSPIPRMAGNFDLFENMQAVLHWQEDHGEADSHIGTSRWWCQLLRLLVVPLGYLLPGQNHPPVLPKWLCWTATLPIEVSHLCCPLLLFLALGTHFGIVFNRWYHSAVECTQRTAPDGDGAAGWQPCASLLLLPGFHLPGIRGRWWICCFVECTVIQII